MRFAYLRQFYKNGYNCQLNDVMGNANISKQTTLAIQISERDVRKAQSVEQIVTQITNMLTKLIFIL